MDAGLQRLAAGRRIRKGLVALPLGCIVALVAGCASSGTSQGLSQSRIVTIRHLLSQPDQYADMQLEVRGHFRGTSGSCSGPAPISPFDWMLEDATGCIYVYGLLPMDLDLNRPQDEVVLVRGTMHLSGTKPYIDSNHVTVLTRNSDFGPE